MADSGWRDQCGGTALLDRLWREARALPVEYRLVLPDLVLEARHRGRFSVASHSRLTTATVSARSSTARGRKRLQRPTVQQYAHKVHGEISRAFGTGRSDMRQLGAAWDERSIADERPLPVLGDLRRDLAVLPAYRNLSSKAKLILLVIAGGGHRQVLWTDEAFVAAAGSLSHADVESALSELEQQQWITRADWGSGPGRGRIIGVAPRVFGSFAEARW